MQQLNILDDIEENEVIEELALENSELGKLPKSWQVSSIGDLGNVTKLAGFEYTDHFKYVEDGEIIALRALNVREGVLDLNNIKRIYKSVSDKLVRSKLIKGDILFTYVGANIGQFALVEENDKYHLAPNICRIRTNETCIPYFLYCYFRTKYFRDNLANYSVGSSQPTLPMGNIRKILIPLPTLPEQEQIAKILSSLDDKIELNQKMNKTLEEMAQAIFKDWFINFEFPNEEGKPYKSSGGEMADSELGDIPNSWKVCKVSDLFDISIGRTPPREEKHWFSHSCYDIPWVSIRDLGINGTYVFNTSEYLTKEAINKFNIRVIPKDTVILSFKLTVGKVSITSQDMTTNEAIAHFNIVEKSKLNTQFIYCYLKQFDYNSLGSTSSIATAVNSKILKTIPIMVPNKDILLKFSLISEQIFYTIKNNLSQINNLIKIRESLLPKLMSGDIRTNSSPSPFSTAFKGSKEGG